MPDHVSTDEIRERYVGESYLSRFPAQRDTRQERIDREKFDRWLAAHDAETTARAIIEHTAQAHATATATALRIANHYAAENIAERREAYARRENDYKSTLAQRSPNPTESTP